MGLSSPNEGSTTSHALLHGCVIYRKFPGRCWSADALHAATTEADIHRWRELGLAPQADALLGGFTAALLLSVTWLGLTIWRAISQTARTCQAAPLSSDHHGFHHSMAERATLAGAEEIEARKHGRLDFLKLLWSGHGLFLSALCKLTR